LWGPRGGEGRGVSNAKNKNSRYELAFFGKGARGRQGTLCKRRGGVGDSLWERRKVDVPINQSLRRFLRLRESRKEKDANPALKQEERLFEKRKRRAITQTERKE